jgi:hypothetical protein
VAWTEVLTNVMVYLKRSSQSVHVSSWRSKLTKVTSSLARLALSPLRLRMETNSQAKEEDDDEDDLDEVDDDIAPLNLKRRRR